MVTLQRLEGLQGRCSPADHDDDDDVVITMMTMMMTLQRLEGLQGRCSQKPAVILFHQGEVKEIYQYIKVVLEESYRNMLKIRPQILTLSKTSLMKTVNEDCFRMNPL